MLVSVIIPSYNHEAYLPRAVESVLDQSHADIELIVIDDGSKDGSVRYLESVQDERLRFYTQANRGAHNAINRGLMEAKGDYLAILNSDDIFARDRIARCVASLKNTGAELAATWIEVINSKGKVLGVKEAWRNMLPWDLPTVDWRAHGLDGFSGNLLMSNFVATTSNVVFTRALYERVGGMRNFRFAHDWDFLLRAARVAKCTLLEEPLLQYRIHDSNTISSNRQWMLFEICLVYALGWRLFEDQFLFNDTSESVFVRDVDLLARAINLQGNDKVFWMLREFLEIECRRGVARPEELLLENPALREPFVKAIAC